MTNEELEKLHQETFKQRQKVLDSWYFYYYEEYRKIKHKEIIKRAFRYNGVDQKSREIALDYVQHRREIHKHSKVKFYNQLRLIDFMTGKSYMISGGEWGENLFGMAWEAELLKNGPYKGTELMYGTSNIPQMINNERCFYPGINEDNCYISGEMNSNHQLRNETLIAFEANKDQTIDNTSEKYNKRPYHEFRKQTIKYDVEMRLKRKAQIEKLINLNNKSYPITLMDQIEIFQYRF